MSHRVETLVSRPGYVEQRITLSLTHDDGYHIVVTWEAVPKGEYAPGYWVARLTGCKAERSSIGTGETQTQAILDLCCALACLADALAEGAR